MGEKRRQGGIKMENLEETSSEVYISKHIRLLARVGLVALGLTSVLALSLVGKANKRDKNYHHYESLVNRVVEKAAGEDKILSVEEKINMARGLGYERVIDPQFPIHLCAGQSDTVKTSMGYGAWLYNGEKGVRIADDKLKEYLGE
jgi:hypothetical protein